MKIALVHDDLIQYGGAEKLLLAMHEIWPNAPIYTSIYNRQLEKIDKRFAKCEIRTSWMQRLPFKNSLRRVYFPLYPAALESIDFSEFNVVLSSSTRFAHGVITKPQTLHVCYSNSPTRFLWETEKYLEYESFGNPKKLILLPILSFLRIWDQQSARRPDFWIANSKNVAEKLQKYHRVEAEVIYPFVDLGKFRIKNNKRLAISHEPYYLVVSRLVAWKRVDIAIEAANYLKFPLKIVGAGPAFPTLSRIAKSNIDFLGEVGEEELISLYQNCRVLILPQGEDFGITAIEAQACGKPVIALKSGGVLETVLPGKTGIFFEEQKAESLIQAIKKFGNLTIKPEDCRKNAQKFGKSNFQKSLRKFVNETWLRYISPAGSSLTNRAS